MTLHRYPANIYSLKVNKGNNRTIYELRLTLTMKIPMLLLTLNRFQPMFFLNLCRIMVASYFTYKEKHLTSDNSQTETL